MRFHSKFVYASTASFQELEALENRRACFDRGACHLSVPGILLPSAFDEAE